MRAHITAINSDNSQRGAVLLVGLIILLLASLLAVGTMNNTNLQEKMVANSQSSNKTFQTAESAVDDKIKQFESGKFEDLTLSMAEFEKSDPAWPTSTYSLTDSSISTSLEILYQGSALAFGGSLDADESNKTSLESSVFEIRAYASMSGSGAKSTIVQGVQSN